LISAHQNNIKILKKIKINFLKNIQVYYSPLDFNKDRLKDDFLGLEAFVDFFFRLKGPMLKKKKIFICCR
jgi:hypothetical protein